TVRGWRRLPRAGGRRVKADHLEHVAAVGGASHHHLDRHVLETNDPIDPLAAEHPGSPQSKPSSARKRTISSRSSTTRPTWTKLVTPRRLLSIEVERLAVDRRAAGSRGYRPSARSTP